MATGTDAATTTLSILGRGCVTVAFNAIYVLSPELYPTEVRNIGMGVSSFFARVSGMMAPFVGGPMVGDSIAASSKSTTLKVWITETFIPASKVISKYHK